MSIGAAPGLDFYFIAIPRDDSEFMSTIQTAISICGFQNLMKRMAGSPRGLAGKRYSMLKRINYWLVFAAVVVSGISAGAMLGEQKTMVPFWMELSPEAFHAWYGKNAARLSGFFAPWQIASAVLALVTAISCRIQGHPGTLWLALAAFFSIAVLATFFLFFKETNAGFVAHKLTAGELSKALSNWSTWQWARICLGVATFCTALLGATRGGIE